MSLNLNQLEKVRETGGGILRARCPACAEGGQDRTGEHLRIYPDGRFGCCVHPKDREHRKRIFALAGVKERGTFSVRVKVAEPIATVQSVKASLSSFSVGTAGTGKTESKPSEKMASQTSQDSESSFAYGQCNYFGTLGTAIFNPYTYARKKEDICITHPRICKDWELPVPSVPDTSVSATLDEGESNPPKQRLPHFTPGGTLVIPFDSQERYHWWRGGQSVQATRNEILERKENYASDF